jgi:hypothetical protein
VIDWEPPPAGASAQAASALAARSIPAAATSHRVRRPGLIAPLCPAVIIAALHSVTPLA